MIPVLIHLIQLVLLTIFTFSGYSEYMDQSERQKPLRLLLTDIKEPIIIGITGDSGSGKTTYSNGIRRLLGTDIVKTITMDGYHKENRIEREKSGKLPLDPNENKLDLLFKHLTDLKKGLSVNIPVYNHATGMFDPPMVFTPAPIIILEGLHALYPQFLPLLDFRIYVDPTRDVKWQWKYERDVKLRGHEVKPLLEEMFKRESAYKRWIDFQKTDANIVIKILQSKMGDFARYEMTTGLPERCYKVELIIESATDSLPTLQLPFDLASLLHADKPPFLIAAVPSRYWGRKTMVVHIDGVLPEQTISALENHIVEFTGIPVESALPSKFLPAYDQHEVSATQFAQLLIAWRFLEQVNNKISPKR
jgi:phosphoribulokinase